MKKAQKVVYLGKKSRYAKTIRCWSYLPEGILLTIGDYASISKFLADQPLHHASLQMCRGKRIALFGKEPDDYRTMILRVRVGSKNNWTIRRYQKYNGIFTRNNFQTIKTLKRLPSCWIKELSPEYKPT